MSKITSIEFTNDMLTDFQYDWVHNLNTYAVIPVWYDDNGVNRTTTDVFTIINANILRINVGDIISGQHTIVLSYEYNASLSGRKLFELDTIDDPDDDHRIALGKEGFPTRNMRYDEFLDKASEGLSNSYFLLANNFSELNNGDNISIASKARQNLGVFSYTQSKALLNNYVLNESILNTANTNSLYQYYNPVSPYNLTTKNYVDTLHNAQKPVFTDLVIVPYGSAVSISQAHVNIIQMQGCSICNASFVFTCGSMSVNTYEQIASVEGFKNKFSDKNIYFQVRSIDDNTGAYNPNDGGQGALDVYGRIYATVTNTSRTYFVSFSFNSSVGL